jgi:hypothetical protein
MIYSFNLLITKRASLQMRQVSFGQTISSPYTTKENQPDEEFAARRSPVFQFSLAVKDKFVVVDSVQNSILLKSKCIEFLLCDLSYIILKDVLLNSLQTKPISYKCYLLNRELLLFTCAL